jgi:basic membrane protein A
MSYKHHRLFGAIIFTVVAILALTACAQPPAEPVEEEAPAAEEQAEEPMAEETEEPMEEAEAPAKVLLITGTGGLGDEGFNDAGYEGAQRAVEDFGIELDLVEPQEMAEFEPQYRSAASSGEYLLIVGLGFAQEDAANRIAEEFPEQNIATIDSASGQPNVQGVLFREQENAFLAGILAAHVTQQTELEGINEDKVIGIVLGIDAPHVRRYAVSYEAGAKTVDPEMEVLVGVVGDFQDQAKAKELSLAQIDQGADIIYQVAGGAGLGVFTAAEEQGVYAIGEGLNQNPLHPEFIVASTYKRMGDAVYDAIEAALNGEFVGGDQLYGFSEGYLIVDLEGSEVPVSDEALAALEEYEAKLASGEIVAPFDEADLEEYLSSIGQ